MPFSTHGVLLLFIGVSLPGLGLCEALFQFVVNEAVGWGLITSAGFGEAGDVFVVRVIRGLSRAKAAAREMELVGDEDEQVKVEKKLPGNVVKMEDEDEEGAEKSAERKKDD